MCDDSALKCTPYARVFRLCAELGRIAHFAGEQQRAGRFVLDQEHKRSVGDEVVRVVTAELVGEHDLGGRVHRAALFVDRNASLLQDLGHLQTILDVGAARQQRK